MYETLKENVIEKFLESAVKQYIEVDVNGKPNITYTKSEVIVKIKKDLLRKSDEFVNCMNLFTQNVKGEWMGYNNCAFSIKRSLPEQPAERLLDVPLSDLVVGPQPRLYRSEESKQRLLRSIKDRLDRGYPPFTDRFKTRPSRNLPGKHEMIDGYGRWDIALILDLASVPIIEREISEAEAWEIAYIANEDRDEFSDFERGKYFKDMLTRFPQDYPTQQALADMLGENRARIVNLISAYEKVREEQKNIPSESVRRRTEELPQSVVEVVFRAPESIRTQVLTDVATGNQTRQEVRDDMASLNEKVEAGVSPEQALEEVKTERASIEEAIEETMEEAKEEAKSTKVSSDIVWKSLQDDAAEKVKIEEAKFTKLTKLYPVSMVEAAVRCNRWLGETQITAILKSKTEVLWNRLTPEEQNLLFAEV